MTRKQRLSKVFYNAISSILGKEFPKHVKNGKYNKYLNALDLEQKISFDMFVQRLDSKVPYKNLEDCKFVWSHKTLNGDFNNDFYVVLRRMTLDFISDGDYEDWILKKPRNPETKEYYRRSMKNMLFCFEHPSSFKPSIMIDD